jgi:hypothetical protein
MAARGALSPIQQQKTRDAIQTSQLINRLQGFALAEEGVDIDSQRLKAIEILLRKSLPDLSSMTLEGGEDPIHTVNEIILRGVRSDR